MPIERNPRPQAPVKLSDPTAMRELRGKLARAGWTLKARFMDKDFTQPLIGIRLTSAQKLFDRALSIQILDRSTVTVQHGFTNDEAVTLTDEDGRDFLEWLREGEMHTAMAALWDQLPEPDSSDARVMARAAVDIDKNNLVLYVAEWWPEVFGRNGLISTTGASFHGELLKILRDPKRDDLKWWDQVIGRENVASEFYVEANVWLRGVAQQAAAVDEVSVTRAMDRVRALIIAAERLRELANDIRQRMDTPPPVRVFPEAITLDADGAGFAYPKNAPATNAGPDSLAVDDIAGVMDASSAHFRQMGRVASIHAGGVGLQISGVAGTVLFRFDQLMRMA